MMDTQETYGGENLRKKGQISRRVVEMNAYGYILRDRTWTYTEDGFIREGGGLGEEFAYVTVEDYIRLAGLALPSWLDNAENGGEGDGEIDSSPDLRVFLDDIVQVEHRSVGWSVADNDPVLDESTDGIVRFIEYGLFGTGDDFETMPLSVRFQRTAEGLKKGMYYTGTTLVPGERPLYTRQYFRDPLRPSDVTADVTFTGVSGPSVKLAAPPDIDQSPDPGIAMTRVLTAYDMSGSTGDSYLDQPMTARMVIGPPRQVRPGSEWFYPVELEHYVNGDTEWSATGLLSHPIDPNSSDDINLNAPAHLASNSSPHNSLTWTYYKKDRQGRSDYTVLDAGESETIVLPSNGLARTLPEYPGTWRRFPSSLVAPAHNFITDFEYDTSGLRDVYYPNGFRWARRLYTEDTNDDMITDFVYEFVLNDLYPNADATAYVATSPGQYKFYEGESAFGVPEFDRRVRYTRELDIDSGDQFAEELVTAIKLHESNPAVHASPVERMAEVLFAVDANGRLQRADLMDFDPLGRPMAIGYTERNDLGEIFRERGIDGTVHTQIRNSLGQTLRRYAGTVDKGWFGEQSGADNMVLKERIEYGDGVHDAWLPTVVRRYTDRPAWDSSYADHFEEVTAPDPDGVATVTKYDWRMRPVVTQSHAKGDPATSGVMSTSVTYLDHADRPVLEATFGAGSPGIGTGTDPSVFAENELPPSPAELFNLGVPLTSLVASNYGPDGTLVERRVYNTDWTYGVGQPQYTSEIMLNGLGGQQVYSQMSGAAAEVTRIDNLGRVAQVASVVPGTLDGAADGYELTRTDNTHDSNGNVIVVQRWERVISDADPVLGASNAVCSTTANWYDEKRRLVATADLGTEDEDGVYENRTGPRYLWSAGDVPHYIHAQNALVIPGSLPADARVSIYVYGDGDPNTRAVEDEEEMSHTVAPNGMVTKYEYTGTGQVWRKIESMTAQIAGERRCTQYEYRYGKVQQIIAYDAYPIPPPNSDSNGLLQGIPYQQTIVAYDDAGDAGGLDPNNADGAYGGEVVDSAFAVVSRDGSLITTVHLPDPITGAVAETSQSSLNATETFRLRYNFAGQIAERKDAGGRVFRYTYDDLARLTQVQVGYYNGGTFVHGYADSMVGVPADRVARVIYAFDERNRVESVTAYDLSGGIVSQNAYEYDGRANITREYQQYGGAVSAESPFIGYAWEYRATEFGSGSTQVQQVLHPGHDRLASILYPVPDPAQQPRELTFGYGAADSHSDRMSWLETIDSNLDSPRVASFTYHGDRRRTRRETAGGEIVWKVHNASSTGLVGLDSFGRIRYHSYSDGDEAENFYHAQHTYDKSGNLLAQVIQQAYYPGWTVNDRSRVNTYNLLGQLTGTRVGIATWDAGSDRWVVTDDPANPAADNLVREDTWTLDNLGNWRGDPATPGRLIVGDLDTVSVPPSAGFWTWGVDSTIDTLGFTHSTDKRNMIDALEHAFDGQAPSVITPVYDAAGNCVDDGSYLYSYDAWNRLVQVKVKQGGALRRHYTYDGLGRLIKTTTPSNASNRVEHHHYDGVRRVQTVSASGLLSGGLALSSGDPTLEQLALESEPSGETVEPENTNLALASGQLGLMGQGFSVYREYVWGPGDAGVDELLVYYDAGGGGWWCLTDPTGDVVGVCDLEGPNGTARVCAQWTYDAYGSVMTSDHIWGFERPQVGHKGLFVDRLDLASPLGPQLAPFAKVIYHNRNRAYAPLLGRFLQQDPNATGAVVADASAYHGRSSDPAAPQNDLGRRFGDGANLYQYLGGSPWMRSDPSGLFFLPGPGDFITGALRSLVSEYAARQEWDLQWALDWESPHDVHSRLDNSWVELAILRGLYEEYDIGVPFTDLSLNPLDFFGGRYVDGITKRFNQTVNYLGRGLASFAQVKSVIVNGVELKAYLYFPPDGGRKLVRFDTAAIKMQTRVQITNNPAAEARAATKRMVERGRIRPEHVHQNGRTIIIDGVTYVWHHHSFKPGIMQLIPEELHSSIGHTGRAAY